MQAAQAAGAELMAGTVEGVALSEDGRRITGALVDGKVMQADIVVIAMGPWSILACQWLPLPAVYGLKGHSLVFRYTPSQPRALFVEIETETGEIETPEVVPRTDGTTYVCGLSSQPPLPVDPSEVVGDEGAHDRLLAMTATFAPELGAAEVLAEQACYRPITTDGMPLIGRVPGIGGAFVATGHSVWGMLNGPATGEALAELIVDGAATTVDITPFNPARLPLFEGSVE
jgi:glycine/D-amino acid oxidase-like deaminating enzyme